MKILFWLLYLYCFSGYWLLHWCKLLCLYSFIFPSISTSIQLANIYFIIYCQLMYIFKRLVSPSHFLPCRNNTVILLLDQTQLQLLWQFIQSQEKHKNTQLHLFTSFLGPIPLVFNICCTLSYWSFLAVSWKACKKSRDLLAILRTILIQQAGASQPRNLHNKWPPR